MVYVKDVLEYTDTSKPFTPGPKNGHLSEKDPQWAELEGPVEQGMAALWAPEVTIDKFKEGWASSPLSLPDGCPEPGKDVLITQDHVTVRDGTSIEIQIYKSPNVQKNAALVFRTHSGGWTVCKHEVEEGENRSLGAIPSMIVVSVDFRM